MKYWTVEVKVEKHRQENSRICKNTNGGGRQDKIVFFNFPAVTLSTFSELVTPPQRKVVAIT